MKRIVVGLILATVACVCVAAPLPKSEIGMSSSGIKVYYAHDPVFYGTPEAEADLNILGKFGMNVVDPSWPSIQDIVTQMRADGQTEEEVVEYLMRYVDSCDALVFRKMADGTISAVVQTAIDRARGAGKPVLQIPVFPVSP